MKKNKKEELEIQTKGMHMLKKKRKQIWSTCMETKYNMVMR